MKREFPKLICDGNEAVARIAHKTNEVCAIYPITPSSPMGEHADVYSANGQTNIWGNVPKIIEMQSEGGAAGAVHGALQGGALTSTFTASQGLLLMIPNMYKMAGELLPAVLHVAARTIATHALSIFGDHSDVMATRQTGFAMLFGGSVQEAQDFALITQVATLKSRIPFLNVFDGFRTSHEISKIDSIPDDIIKAMMPEDEIMEHKMRSLDPDNPVIRGTAQNPDVFFQAREAANKYYDAVPGIVEEVMDEFYEHTGRRYKPFDYLGHPEAERVIIIMGSGEGPVQEVVETLKETDEKVGALFVRLYRPFSIDYFLDKMPKTVKKIAVMDRTKESGSIGDPLYLDVVTAYVEKGDYMPSVVGGRYGLSSKEFTPAMVMGIFNHLKADKPRNHFTVGIVDDVSNSHIDYDPVFNTKKSTYNCMFYGLGSDGTVSANKNSIKIIGDTTDNYVQGYFVYDSNKAGSMTTSHLRFGPDPIRSTYLVNSADFLAVHKTSFIDKYDLIKKIKKGGIFLLNTPYGKDEIWAELPKVMQEQIIEKEVQFYVIDATKTAIEAKMGRRTNTILQTAFFAISGILPSDQAIDRIKKAIVKSYSHKGDALVQMNFNAVDKALESLNKVDYPKHVSSDVALKPMLSGTPSQWVSDVLGTIIAGEGDSLPVSSFSPDGTFPTGTTQYQKRGIADFIPVWDEDLCTQCNHCVNICPHAAIRSKVVDNTVLETAPDGCKKVPAKGKPFLSPTESFLLQVSPDDCTGCNLCVEVCPAESKEIDNYKSINMTPYAEVDDVERVMWDHFIELPDYDRTKLKLNTIKGVQLLEPLFEFSGACPGCGETPYIKMLTQLYGDSMLIANATGCSSIYGGNLPTTPYKKNADGRGPAWANSLFEDNAEYGLGMKLALSKKEEIARYLLDNYNGKIDPELKSQLLLVEGLGEQEKADKIAAISKLKEVLKSDSSKEAKRLSQMADYLRKKQVWIFGGDGWAYDIGYGGLDHAIASGENVNILVMDTEVYSNTGGQTSKATPVGASAKFSVAGKSIPKKDLAMQALAYGFVYVAQIAMAAKPAQTLKALQEAAEYDGPSLILAYSNCIEHGYDQGDAAIHQKLAVDSGYWPLFRYNPSQAKGKRFKLDYKEPKIPVGDFMYKEARFNRVVKRDADYAKKLLDLAQDGVNSKWDRLQLLKDV